MRLYQEHWFSKSSFTRHPSFPWRGGTKKQLIALLLLYTVHCTSSFSGSEAWCLTHHLQRYLNVTTSITITTTAAAHLQRLLLLLLLLLFEYYYSSSSISSGSGYKWFKTLPGAVILEEVLLTFEIAGEGVIVRVVPHNIFLGASSWSWHTKQSSVQIICAVLLKGGAHSNSFVCALSHYNIGSLMHYIYHKVFISRMVSLVLLLYSVP